MKKKPLVCRNHRLQSNDTLSMPRECWVTSVAALTNSDLVASGEKRDLWSWYGILNVLGVVSLGSSDGFVVAWKCGENYRSMEPLFSLHLVNF